MTYSSSVYIRTSKEETRGGEQRHSCASFVFTKESHNMILACFDSGTRQASLNNSVSMRMDLHRAILLLLIAMLFPSHSESQRAPRPPTAEQSGFNSELEVDPVLRPVALSGEALGVLAKDKHITSCLDSRNLPPEKLPANWFVASLIHLDGPKEPDFIVLPAGRLPETPEGEISANACLVGANTGGFWVLRQTSMGFQLVLSQMAHSLDILKTRSNGLRDIRLYTVALSKHTIQDFRFDGRMYRLSRTRTRPNG